MKFQFSNDTSIYSLLKICIFPLFSAIQIVPIVTTEHLRHKREDKKKYETNSGLRLLADNMMQRTKLHEYQNCYAVALRPFGLQHGIANSTAKQQANPEYYKQQMNRYEEDYAKMQTELLNTAITLATGNPTQVHVGTGSGGLSADLP